LEILGYSGLGKMNVGQLLLLMDEAEGTDESFKRTVQDNKGRILDRKEVSQRMAEWWISEDFLLSSSIQTDAQKINKK
jgi:hypothetical protein